ncbi:MULTISPECIES: DUF2759 domain-containing protein [Bacillaceae]|jgi:drug/metabolite transporter (DMT)-like permease|uniref:Drug/metabolite transporter (DMT)-like permease n=4 Tax=Anoxybacillaceae TaxID=3120669 RepID=A0A6G9J684_9BACL|nr:MULTISPECIES: DUF2759 domain-containing protein [Bacillaceae]NNU91861.1 DUF2759 domain-containing protein [Geobacillus sp. NFOSA3]PDM41331.1 DUF2759 domain-containing protein [Parageobacillus yumthangensis]TXK91348.1 DUF2759 domain-containing protein [Parageobacillus sp. SY1]KYD25748.1 hypothetical protein B4110_2569 [Parageobacillus toebii]MBB3867433.1 drug/metabolite transporter (DMT)-like permease [Parageobacillus toebii NBRC 107807]
MGTVIIFALVALLALYGVVRSLRDKNILGVLFGLGAVAVFGWFTIMTVLHHGIPTGTH